jgi:uncharacterized protein YggU (UPF0235/DUF167 family)
VILELQVQRLAAPPVERKAPTRRNVRIAAGHKSRRKRVVVEGAQWKTKSAA